MRVQEETELDESVEWFLDHLRVERGCSPNTVDAYRRDLLAAAEFLRKKGFENWRAFDAPTALAFRGSLSKFSSATVSRKTTAVRSLIRFLIARGINNLELPEAAGLRAPKALPKALSLEQVDAILGAIDTRSPAGLRDKAMLELLFGTGMRVSELISLTSASYTRSESLLRVLGKRGKTRVLPIPAETHDVLTEYLETARPQLIRKIHTDRMFLNKMGKPISRSGVFRILQVYARQAGIESAIGPHTLRHTYAVQLVRAGADLRSVQELLGHASVATTEVYTHLDMETVRKKYIDAHPRARKR